MQIYLLPIVFTFFLWWFSTGLIFYLDGLPRHTFRWSFMGATVLLFVSLWWIATIRNDTSLSGAYLAFTFGTLVWGWQMISFYMGFITGPRHTACPQPCSLRQRFWYALQTCIHHELASLAGAIMLLILTWGSPNQIALWTYVLMWWMHLSAKLNVFFGVPNLDEKFLPEHLQYLCSYLPKRAMNTFFPVSVSVSTVVGIWLIVQTVAPGNSAFTTVGLTFLSILMVLAILEHWVLVVPLPLALWDWVLRIREASERDKREKQQTKSIKRAELSGIKHSVIDVETP